MNNNDIDPLNDFESEEDDSDVEFCNTKKTRLTKEIIDLLNPK